MNLLDIEAKDWWQAALDVSIYDKKNISQVQKCFLCHVTPSSLASIGIGTWAEGEAGSTSAIESDGGKCLQVLC